jgi:hypothetical protein
MCRGLPSVRILVAFCSEIPLICSSIRFGLIRLSILQPIVDAVHSRISYGLDCMQPTIKDQLNISFGEPIDTL